MGKFQKLKSLIKLNKLFHYKFIVPKSLFYDLKIKAYFVTSLDDKIIFYGNKKLYNTLKEYNIDCFDQYKCFLKVVVLKKIVIIITFILVCFIFLSSSNFIREIKFKDETMYDHRVYQYVINKLDKKFFLYSLNDDLNNLSLSLRAAFPNYAYIGIDKSGSSLVIDIEKIDLKNKNNIIKVNYPIVSNYNAVICGISCKEGVVHVTLNQSVKKGEMLVSPNNEKGFCEAVILGNMAEYRTIKVKKEKLIYDYTGKMEHDYNIKVGNNYLMKFKDIYNDQAIKINKIVNFFNLIEVSKVYYYDKNYTKIVYDYVAAYNYAVSLIYANLELYRKSPIECINNILLLNYVENDEEFIFNFLINQVKSIGIYSYL